jgi:hypothetical protein
MQKSELRNPAPSRGYRDFPRVQKHASFSEPNTVPRTGLAKPSVHNTVFHPAANSNATYPFFAGRYTNDWQKGFVEGMPMFVNMEHNRTFSDSRGTLTGRHTSHNIMASIPVLNFYLTIASTEANFARKFIQKYSLNEALIPIVPTDEEVKAKHGQNLNDDSIKYLKDEMFIQDFMAKWRFMGVILSDMDVQSNYQKLFNLNVRGRTRIFNLFTTRMDSHERNGSVMRHRVMKNDQLYFVLKKCYVDELAYRTPDGSSMALTPPPSDDGMVWQIKTERLSLRQKPQEVDSNGNLQKFIYCGKVLNAVSKKPDEHYVRKAFREHTQMACLPLIEVALATGHY